MSRKENIGWTKPTLETWAKPCKNKQHIGSIKQIYGPKIQNVPTLTNAKKTANDRKHDTKRTQNCLDIIVAHQYGATKREVLLKITPLTPRGSVSVGVKYQGSKTE